MTQLDVVQFLQRRPFEPFRLILADGEAYESHHPEMAIGAPGTIVVGTPSAENPAAAAR